MHTESEELMSNRVVKVTRQNWGQRVSNSFGGLVFGLLLIPAAMAVLWYGEGVQDLSKIASKAVQVDATQPNAASEGGFISVTGTLGTNAQLGDDPYLMDGDYVSLERVVEMYAWKETSNSSTVEDPVGGGSTTTTYTYSKEWTRSPDQSSSFKEPYGHENPAKVLEDATITADYATIDSFELNPQSMQLPDGEKITPTAVELPNGYVQTGSYIFSSETAATQPLVGDIRISYVVLPVGKTVTAFGAKQGSEIVSTTVEDEKFYRMFSGSHAQALETMHGEYVLTVWLIRVFGTIAIFVGLQLIVQPLARILGVIGIVGRAVEGITGFINGLIAVVLGTTIIIVSQIAHNIYLLMTVLVLVGGGVYLYLRRRNSGPKTVGATTTPSVAAGSDDVDTSPPSMT
jgi:hypothetical protein